MRNTLIALSLSALVAVPALAHDHPRGDADLSYLRDYQTDLSEAKRELRSDLRRAENPSDRAEAWAEYRREVADAKNDYNKEMIEKGYYRGTVEVLEDGS